MTKKNFIAFVDLLGTSELSRVDPDGFYTSLTTFQETIGNSSSLLVDTGEVYFFSDCAYVESTNLDSMVNYMREVRQTLLEQGLYLKGAIGSGFLKAQEPQINSIKDIKNIDKRKPVVKGSSFGPDVVRIYALQDGLRGIGIRLDESVREVFKKRGFGITSCHLPQINSRHAECFYDLKLSEAELDERVLRMFVRNFFKTNTKSRRFGRYYLSFIVSWINSADFSRSGQGEQGDKTENMPLIFQVLLNGMLEKHFSDLAGIEFIYFAFLEKLYEQCNSQKIIIRFENYIANKKKLISRLQTMPLCIFGEESRKRFLDYLSGRITGSL